MRDRMTEISTVVRKIYPTPEDLKQESNVNVSCPVVGCLKVFRQSSALRFHLVKLHKLILNESDARLAQQSRSDIKTAYEFYCPESACRFNVQQFFQSFKKLKQHYRRVHGLKAFSCSVCGEKFGLGYDLSRHFSRCCKKPWCRSCKTCLGDSASLVRHCDETGHKADPSETKEDEGSELKSDLSTDELIRSKTLIQPTPGSVELENLPGIGTEIVSRGSPRSSEALASKHRTVRNSHGKHEQKIAPKISLPSSDFLAIATQTATVILYKENRNSLKPALKKLAPKIPKIPDIPHFLTHLPNQTQDCPNSRSARTSKSARKPKSASTQATQTRRRKIKVAETQTTEEFEMTKVLTNAALSKQSCGSQVSPRAKVKRSNWSVQSTQTQTSRSLSKRRKVHASEENRSSSSAPTAAEAVYDDWPDFTHNETQTMDFLHELCVAENSSTQTFESYLFGCLSSDEVGGNYPTISANTNLSDSTIFSNEISNIMNLGVGPSEQNVGYPYQDLLNSSEIVSSMATHDDVSSEQKMFVAETQTADSDLISNFLAAASQTTDFDDTMAINTETQTADDFFAQVWSHMETQTTDEFLTDFGFSDIETQTTWILGHTPLVQDPTVGNGGFTHRDTASMDMETQTYFQ